MINFEDLKALVLPHVKQLKPYSSARDEYKGDANIFLDANENPYPLDYNRYPDPYQIALKKELALWKGVDESQIFVSNGSDEVIDLLIRAFCKSGLDSVVSLNPSYGMYSISANIQDIAHRTFELDQDFNFEVNELLSFLTKTDKILFLCSPNNPTGQVIPASDILTITENYPGIVVVDEAYIDFANIEGVSKMAGNIPNLVVIQTLSKAMGAAGMRLGYSFMHPYLVEILNKIKPPYNVNAITQQYALGRIKDREKISMYIKEIVKSRKILQDALLEFPFVLRVFPSEANFILLRVIDPDAMYRYLADVGIIVRNRNNQYGCAGCLRLTVGTSEENEKLLKTLSDYHI